jgi:hypothetical protein
MWRRKIRIWFWKKWFWFKILNLKFWAYLTEFCLKKCESIFNKIAYNYWIIFYGWTKWKKQNELSYNWFWIWERGFIHVINLTNFQAKNIHENWINQINLTKNHPYSNFWCWVAKKWCNWKSNISNLGRKNRTKINGQYLKWFNLKFRKYLNPNFWKKLKKNALSWRTRYS